MKQKTYKKELHLLDDKEIQETNKRWNNAERLNTMVVDYTNKDNEKDSVSLKVAGASVMPSRVAYMFGVQYGIEFARKQDAIDKKQVDAILTGIESAIGIQLQKN
tara:strand:- start:440 stop:754 length:315 start_codon:yes stop_codon:yes gene_type:complete